MSYKKSLYSLCLAIFPLMVCSGMVYSILPLYVSSELGASPRHIGLLYMVGAATGAVFAPFLGRLSDKFGRHRILLACTGGFAVAFALYSLIRDFIEAFPIYALEGVSWAALGAIVPALIADTVPPEDRGWAMGVYERTWSIGWIIGPLAGGFLADTIGFRITFALGAILIGLGIIHYIWKRP